MKTTLVTIALVLLAVSDSSAANRVWTVAGLSVGADFTTTQAAIDAATDGDVIVVIDGTDGNVVLDGKSLTIFRDPAGFTEPSYASFVVKNVGAQQRVVLRDLRIGSQPLELREMRIENCAGPVLLEECEMFLRVTDSPNVLVARGILSGRNAATFTNPQVVVEPGLRVTNSSVACYDALIRGGIGGSAGTPPFGGPPVPSEPGKPAIELVSGSLFLAKCVVEGGHGGYGAFVNGNCIPSSDGGAGVVVGGALRTMETTFAAGTAGIDAPGCAQVGFTPPAVVITTGTLVNLPDTLRRLWVSPLAKLPDVVTTWLRGQPGENAILFVSLVPAGGYVPSLRGALVCGSPLVVIPVGPIGANGEVVFQTPVSATLLPPGIEGVQLFEQFAVAGSTGTGLLSSPSFVTLWN